MANGHNSSNLAGLDDETLDSYVPAAANLSNLDFADVEKFTP